MNMVRLERTFWAVGHGAFYTEQFVDHNTDQYFTAVYDCGGKGIKKSVDDFLKNVKRNSNGKPCVDLLFISHFHYDHINGVQELINKAAVKRIFIPQLSQQRLAEAYIYNSIQTLDKRQTNSTIRSAQQFIVNLATNNIKVPITEVLASGEGNSDEEIIIINEDTKLNDTWNNGQSIGVRYSKEKGDTQLTWLYIPINVGYDEQYAKKLIHKIHSLSSIPIMDDDKHIIWENLDAVLKDADCAKKIKEQYYLLYKKNHNAYSMPVFSGPETIKEKIYEWCEMRLNNLHLADFSMHCWGHCRCFDSCKLSSCLYMGDFEAKNQVNFNALKRILRKYYNAVGLQQVPHHFSQNNHALELYKDRLIAFGNVSSGDKSFSSEVAGDIAFRECHPIVIKEDNTTRIEYLF